MQLGTAIFGTSMCFFVLLFSFVPMFSCFLVAMFYLFLCFSSSASSLLYDQLEDFIVSVLYPKLTYIIDYVDCMFVLEFGN